MAESPEQAPPQPAASAPVAANAATTPPSRSSWTSRRFVPRHARVTRLTHWINVVAMTILLLSGLQIFNAHPALYWGQAGWDGLSGWLQIGDNGANPPHGALRVGSLAVDTTGVLGVSTADGEVVTQAFPGWLTIPSWRDLATGRRWHFFFAWVLVLNAALYLVFSLASGHLWRDIVPAWRELSPHHLGEELWNHLRLRFPKGEAALNYNTLQKLSYAVVIFLLVPVMILTGLTMSPGFDAILPGLLSIFGGRQSARSLHFITANLLVLFVIVHLAALLAVGVWNELRSMFTGRYEIRKES